MGGFRFRIKKLKTLQQVMKWKLLTNWFVKKASKKEEIGKMMSEMIASKESQKIAMESVVFDENITIALRLNYGQVGS